MISPISLFEVISVIRCAKSESCMPDPITFFQITASVADSSAFNLNGIKKHLADGLSSFFIKDKHVFSNGPKSLPRNPSNCTILDNRIFDLADEPFVKVLRTFETCELVNNNLCRKLVSYFKSPTTFDERFKVI